MKFSERFGFKIQSNIIQAEDMNDELRISIWNVFYKFYLEYDAKSISERRNLKISPEQITASIWMRFLKKRIDKIADFGYTRFIDDFEQIFFGLEWYEVYDMIEFILSIDETIRGEEFKSICNKILEIEMSAYRIVNNHVIKNIEDLEINSIENILKFDKYAGAKIHISEALKLLSDKKNPDYRNCIKESISAVESICAIICNKDTATLGEALKIIGKNNQVELHPSLVEGYKKIYGYTSNGDGIRHALLEEDSLEYEDALYMLVSCSAFVNYLISKFEK